MNAASSLPFALALALLAGCAATTPEEGATTSQVRSLCDASCARRARCGRDEATCASACASAFGGGEGHFTATFVTFATRCLPALACNESEERCLADFDAVEPGYVQLPVFRACLERRASCRAAEATFADDYCFSLAALDDTARASADACRGEPCASVPSCLRRLGAFDY